MKNGLLAMIFAASLVGEAVAQEFQPSPAQAEAAQSVVEAYFAAWERGDASAVRALQHEGLSSLRPEEVVQAEIERVNDALGPTIARRFMRVTWYDNPPNSPRPGIYVAFDMVARFDKADRYCGYVIAYQAPEGGPFLIMRMEQTYIENKQAHAAANPPVNVFWPQVARTACPGWTPEWDAALAPL